MKTDSSPSKKKLESRSKSASNESNGSSTKNAFLLPQSKFGFGSDHGDMIVMLIKYFRIVAMVYGVWLIGKKVFFV